jgi:hypothetical protein
MAGLFYFPSWVIVIRNPLMQSLSEFFASARLCGLHDRTHSHTDD